MSEAPRRLGQIAELWRYPVKSMGGERTADLEVLPDGIAHDRRYAFRSSGAPVGKPRLTSRERAAMLRYTARAAGDRVEVLTPEGSFFPADAPALLTHLQQHLPQGHHITLEHEPEASPYTDVRPIAVVSTQTLATLRRTLGRDVDPRRFRANLVLRFDEDVAEQLTAAATDAFPEDALAGHTIRIGAACRLRLLERIPRCRVVTLDPETAEADPELMKHLDRRHGGRLGVYAAVVTPGRIRPGDAICRV